MSRRLIVRPETEADMADAFDWYEGRVPGLGAEFLLCVDAVFNAILRSTQQCKRCQSKLFDMGGVYRGFASFLRYNDNSSEQSELEPPFVRSFGGQAGARRISSA